MAENYKSDGNCVMIDSVSEWDTRPILNESLKEPALKSHLFANWSLVVLYFCQHMLNLQEKIIYTFLFVVFILQKIISMPLISSIFLIPNWFFYSDHYLKTIEPFNQTINQIN